MSTFKQVVSRTDSPDQFYRENILFEQKGGAVYGHGLLEPTDGNGTGALCFVSLLIKLLSVYGNHARDIWANLAEQL